VESWELQGREIGGRVSLLVRRERADELSDGSRGASSRARPRRVILARAAAGGPDRRSRRNDDRGDRS